MFLNVAASLNFVAKKACYPFDKNIIKIGCAMDNCLTERGVAVKFCLVKTKQLSSAILTEAYVIKYCWPEEFYLIERSIV